MKLNQRLMMSIGVAIVVLLSVGSLRLVSYSESPFYGITSYEIIEDSNFNIGSALRKFKTQRDSLRMAKSMYTDGYLFRSGQYNQLLGLLNVTYGSPPKGDSHPYLMVGLGLNINDSIPGPTYLAYYNKNRQGYLLRTKLTVKGKTNYVSYFNEPVKYIYSSYDNRILIPLQSHSWGIVIKIVFFIILLLTLLLFLFILTVFLEFLVAISKNRAFEERNVSRLKYLSIAFLIAGLYNYVVLGATYLIFSMNYPTLGVIINHSFWKFDYFALIISIVCYLIYNAFKRGSILQQEQELTI